MSFWKSIKDTAESLGKAALAPEGAVLDLAQMPFDNKDDNFGTVVSSLSHRGSQALDPVLNPKTLSGTAVSSTMGAMDWALRNMVDEPISTVAILSGHIHSMGGGPFNGLGEWFSGDAWAKAYDIAQHQSTGQSVAYNAFNAAAQSDPYAIDSKGQNPYAQTVGKDHPLAGGLFAFGVNVAGAWELDPFVLAGKGLAGLKAAHIYDRLSSADKAGIFEQIGKEAQRGLLADHLNRASRTDRYLDWINGADKTGAKANALGRPLNAQEILYGSPELRRYAAEPHVIAGLLSDATKLGGVEARNAQRRILAVAAGDPTQVARLRDEIGNSGAIADQLGNMLNDSVIDLRRLAANPLVKHDPALIKSIESQLENLNSAGDIDKFMERWNQQQELLLGTQGTMTHMPSLHREGVKAVNRLNEAGPLRETLGKVDEWSAKRWADAKGSSSLFQKGIKAMPLLVVKPLEWHVKAPLKAADALRQTHFTGVAHLHDWGGATTQLDSMMRLSHVSPEARMGLLNEAFTATTEMEKMRLIDKAESLSMHSLASHHAARTGEEIDRGYIEKLMLEHSGSRAASLAQIRGRAYAATQMPEGMADQVALRAENAGKVADGSASASGGFTAKSKATWRVDHILEDGVPVSLPLIETQLGNSVPLLDMHLADKLLARDQSHLARLSRAWKKESADLDTLTAKAKHFAGGDIQQAIDAKAATVDWLVMAGQKAMRLWKFSVLFRLGYPMRVLMDDHWRIWSQMRPMAFYGNNGKEVLANMWFNHAPAWASQASIKGRGLAADAIDSNLTNKIAATLRGPSEGSRTLQAKQQLHHLTVRKQEILDELEGDRMVAHLDRQDALKKARRTLAASQKKADRLGKRLEEAHQRRSLGTQHEDVSALNKEHGAAVKAAEDAQGHIDYLMEQLGDKGPDELKKELAAVEETLGKGVAGLKAARRKLGSTDVVLDKSTGAKVEGAFGGLHGTALRGLASSKGTFDTQLAGVEERVYRGGVAGAHRTIEPKDAGYLDAYADVLNHQFRQSPVAMHFVNGGDVDGFVRWVKKPEQANLRARLAHFAHDPENWGGRVQAMVYDYIPTQELMEAVRTGRVSAKQLDRMFGARQELLPNIHGRAAADNLGTSERQLGVGKTMNYMMRALGEMPTDMLSRHPFFNSLYKMHASDIYETRKIAYAEKGQKFTQKDFDEITHAARKRALNDVKRTLFDLSAHTHAAHVMRFISPFFAAHQESISRWLRIWGDDPSILRRFTQFYQAPRYLGLVVDEQGNPVGPGDDISSKHRLLIQLPKAFGGPDSRKHESVWQINENAFNLILQNGLTNPGVGPVVQLPLEYLARKYADKPEIERVARVFNPYPPQSPMEAVMPAVFKRLSAYTYGKTGVDPSLGLGIGQREYNDAYAQHVQDLMVEFRLDHGREPNQRESNELMVRAGREATTQMFHRFLWNSLSPAPAQPNSKYAAIQQGWYRISEQARSQGKDFNWAYEQFKAKYGDAYMPLVYSTANNAAGLDSTVATVDALKRYRGVLDKVDPELTRAVIGGYADDLAASDPALGEYSQEAKAYLRSKAMRPGSPDTYYSYDDPRTAMEDQMSRRGWQKYGELTGSLTAMAQQQGLNSYTESDALMAIKRAGVAKLRAENWAFDKAYGSFDPTQFGRYINDLKVVASTPSLAGDAERTDIQTLQAYLQLRDLFTNILEQRQAAGLGGEEAQANAPVRQLFTALVGRLVESNTYFETNMYNGLLERDPLLVGP